MNITEFIKYLSGRVPEGCYITISNTPEYTQKEADELIEFLEKIKRLPAPTESLYRKEVEET